VLCYGDNLICPISTDNIAIPFYEMVILINGEIHSDAGSLVEGDTVLIFYRSAGFKYIYRSPPCSERRFRRKVRAGCVYAGVPCVTDDPNNEHYASTLLYYFRPVIASDDGLTIKFHDSSRYFSKSVTLHGEYVQFIYWYGTCVTYIL